VIVGIGTDVVDVQRFVRTIERTPSVAETLFTAAERKNSSGGDRSVESLAARFAAKEALAKALGGGGGMSWLDAEVVVDEVGRPSLVVTGTVAARAVTLGVARFHVSLSHDSGVATAFVIAEA